MANPIIEETLEEYESQVALAAQALKARIFFLQGVLEDINPDVIIQAIDEAPDHDDEEATEILNHKAKVESAAKEVENALSQLFGPTAARKIFKSRTDGLSVGEKNK